MTETPEQIAERLLTLRDMVSVYDPCADENSVMPVKEACAFLLQQATNDRQTLATQSATILTLRSALEVSEALQESQYKAGISAGWNMGINQDEAGLASALRYEGHLAPIVELRKSTALQTTEQETTS